ncbi:hypothetical protein DLJ47_02375 [Micromonospora sp. S4605]|uniref:hypothetical protein n=1 Tax=Micromonospora sp. S4605 TaxID=1420897 RepID=UPI000D6F4CD2|nr:hypothetical protein [Micromonospora sp. S4605]PWU57504.1 hypothetical protein DLJ47_02375 [Micromonospora sp. S4605]
MTVSGVLLVTAVVWAVSLLRSVRLRAFVYSLPLPMTLALLTTGYRVDGSHLIGVVGLNLFFVLVTVAHHRLRWPILLADLAGVAGYVALGAALLAVSVPFVPALAGTVLLWLLAALLLRRHPPPAAPAPDDPERSAPPDDPERRAAPVDRAAPLERDGDEAAGERLPALAKLALILGGAVSTGLLGQLLRGLVVTFPYAGVLVAVEVRRELPAFCRHFARNSLALVGFLTGCWLCQDLSAAAGLAAGWAGFALTAAVLHLPASRHGKRRQERAEATGNVPQGRGGHGKRGVEA